MQFRFQRGNICILMSRACFGDSLLDKRRDGGRSDRERREQGFDAFIHVCIYGPTLGDVRSTLLYDAGIRRE